MGRTVHLPSTRFIAKGDEKEEERKNGNEEGRERRCVRFREVIRSLVNPQEQQDGEQKRSPRR
jgi:hypothetical protein